MTVCRPGSYDAFPLADLRAGVRQKRFKVASEAAAMDAITGTCVHAMRRIATGQAPAGHATDAAELVLRALGMDPGEAAEVARRPLPPLEGEAPQAQPARAAAARRRAK
ncbi:MAG TPA: hypothetical protein VIL30_26625 [Ramlibacter sp.]|jgi:hypothetical protein